MQLTESDIGQLKPHFKAIQATVNTHTQTNTAPWYVMDEIKFNRTGFRSNGMCASCVIDLYQEFWNLIQQWEQNNQNQ